CVCVCVCVCVFSSCDHLMCSFKIVGSSLLVQRICCHGYNNMIISHTCTHDITHTHTCTHDITHTHVHPAYVEKHLTIHTNRLTVITVCVHTETHTHTHSLTISLSL